MKFDEVEIFDGEKTDVEIIRQMIESKDQEDAFYILDVGDLMRKHEMWLSKLPRITPYYAVKSNPHPTVVKILASLNGNFDCASKREIQQVLDCGISPDKIIFAHSLKPISHIQFARDVGVEKLTADGEPELRKIQTFFPTAKVIIRIQCDAKIAWGKLRGKFGCNVEYEAEALIRIAKDLGLDIHGFSFYAGPRCEEVEVYGRAIKHMVRLVEYAESLGFRNVKMIDIGGGFPGEKDRPMDKFFEAITAALEEVNPSIEIISEPGRYYVASAFTLVSLVYGKRVTREQNVEKYNYFINDGIHGSFQLYVNSKMPIPLDKPAASETYASSFWGPTCNSQDCVVTDCLYPELNIGDWVMWPDMGAYTLALAGTFNGFYPPAVFPFAKRSVWDSFMAQRVIQENPSSNGYSNN